MLASRTLKSSASIRRSSVTRRCCNFLPKRSCRRFAERKPNIGLTGCHPKKAIRLRSNQGHSKGGRNTRWEFFLSHGPECFPNPCLRVRHHRLAGFFFDAVDDGNGAPLVARHVHTVDVWMLTQQGGG